MSDASQHLRLAIRALRRRPAFTLLVVATLALGIGANTAIFSVVKAVLLTPLPYRTPDRLALIWSRWNNFDKTWLSAAEYLDYQQMDRLFDDVAAWGDNGEVALTGPEGPESVIAAEMSSNTLSVLGVAPLLGRAFSAEEDIPNGPPVVMLSYDLWRRRYGGDPGMVGRVIQVDGRSANVVGVLPRSFRFPLEFQTRTAAQVIQPLGLDRSAPNRGNHGYYGVARLKPGVTVGQASGELAALATRWTSEGLYPEAMRFSVFAVSLPDEVSGGVRRALLVLAGAVALLLLLSCANVANLLLTRADGRGRELAVRAALGAGRRHLLRLAMVEGLLLSIAGGLAGLGLAWAGVRLLVARAPTSVPRLSELSVDWGVTGFALLVSVVTGIAFGLVPAVRVSRLNLSNALREGSRGQSGGVERRRARSLLVVAEMALAVLLVIGAGLTVRSFINLQRIDPGFDPRGVLSFRLSLPASDYPEAADVVGFYQQLGDRVRELPGVQAAGFVRLLPLASEIGDAGMVIEGRPTPPNQPGLSADWQAVTPGYFEAMKSRLVRGRFFDATDGTDGTPVIIVNETLVREYFPGEDPVGQRIRVGGATQPFRTVVGVVGDVHHNGITRPVKRAWFIPHAQWTTMFGGPRRAMAMAIRTAGSPMALLPAVQDIVHRSDPNLPLTQVASLDRVLADATREQRFTVVLMSGFAALALVLATVGIYGVISYSVSQRTREIGIRLALGADAERVRRLILSQGIGPAMLGILLGLGSAGLLARFLRTLLYGVAPLDPVTFGTIPVALLGVAVLSVLVPAIRASRVDPVDALRAE